MPKKNFILLSMEDDKIKKISNVISNDSCRKILDYLSSKDATESELAADLGIPISTVHYNLQQLTETGLISVDEYHYSEKGKEVNHYKLANKYIIIAPKRTFGIKEKLRSILPALLIVSGAALFIQLVNKYIISKSLFVQEYAAISQGVAEILTPAMQKVAEDTAQESAVQAAQQTAVSEPNIALWFFVGALCALGIYVVISLLRKDMD